MRSRAVVTLMGMAVGSGAVLGSGVPRFDELGRHLAAPHRWVAVEGSDAAATTLAGTLLWLVALWVAFGLTVTAGSLLPGQAGRIARALADRMTPAVLRRTMVTAAGASILLSPATALATPGAAGPTTAPAVSQAAMPAVGWVTDPSPRAATPSPDAPAKSATTSLSPDAPAATPRTAAAHPGPSAGSPSIAPPPTTAAPPVRPHPGTATPAAPSTPTEPNTTGPVTVRPGDSLWSIAARHLAPDRSAPRIARAWPRWYAANRQAIGSRPDLIRPGTRLVAPPPTGSESGSKSGNESGSEPGA